MAGLETCNLTAYYSHRGIAFDLLSLSRSVALDDAYGHSDAFTISLVPSPLRVEHPDLSGGGFPEGSACHHFDPIRYVVRGASHPDISATVARPRRDQQEHAGYFPDGITICKYN